MKKSLASLLEKKYAEYNRKAFIHSDPVCIPHTFQRKQDIEIAGLFAAVFAWGNRVTIINKSRELLELMDNSPHDFCMNHTEKDLQKLVHFRHRTFNATDLLYFIEFFKQHYALNRSLENAFTRNLGKNDLTVENGLVSFHQYFLSLEVLPGRTKKHIASPALNSSCKRLNMFLRWMVRKDEHGVDFGIWKKIKPAQLVCPLDLHVARVSRKLGLLKRKQNDWKAALELTDALREFDNEDPVKYDLALFGMGVFEGR